MKTAQLPRLISIAQAAKLGIGTRPTINAKIMREEIEAEKVGGRWLVVVASLPKDAQRKLLASPDLRNGQ